MRMPGSDDVTATVTKDIPSQHDGGAGPKPLPAHDNEMAGRFLNCLDPNAHEFTFQFFGDGPARHAEIVHGTLDELWPKVLALNTLERRVAVFVTINETDFRGRRAENVVRARALFVDADTPEQIASCLKGIETSGVTNRKSVV